MAIWFPVFYGICVATGELGGDLIRHGFAVPPSGGLPARSRYNARRASSEAFMQSTGLFSGRSNPQGGRLWLNVVSLISIRNTTFRRWSPLARRHGSQNTNAPRYCLTASAGFACVLPFRLRLQAQPRCARRYLNERAARRVRRRVVHLFTAVAPLQCIAGATSPRGFFESQRGAAGGPLARTPVRLKPCRQKRRSPVSLAYRMGYANRQENRERPHPSRLCRATVRGPAGPFSLKTVHWTVFRALEPPRGKALNALEPPEGKAGKRPHPSRLRRATFP